jgi:hypothetical protein
VTRVMDFLIMRIPRIQCSPCATLVLIELSVHNSVSILWIFSCGGSLVALRLSAADKSADGPRSRMSANSGVADSRPVKHCLVVQKEPVSRLKLRDCSGSSSLSPKVTKLPFQ